MIAMTVSHRITIALLALLTALGITLGAAWLGYQNAGADVPLDAGVVAVDAGVGSAAGLPDPAEAPQESASLLFKLYKAGHLIPAIVVAAFFLLTLLQRWVAWLRTGYRKLVVSSALASLAMLAERAADGTTPNLTMIAGAIGVGLALWMKTEGEPKATA